MKNSDMSKAEGAAAAARFEGVDVSQIEDVDIEGNMVVYFVRGGGKYRKMSVKKAEKYL